MYDVATVDEVGLVTVTVMVYDSPLALDCAEVGVPLTVRVEGEITRRTPVADERVPPW